MMSTTIASLPVETLQDIFLHAFHAVPVEEWHQSLLPSLRLVSPLWNSAAETSPALWASILVTEKSAAEPNAYYDEDSLPEPHILLPTTALAFRRSGTLPLHITIHLPAIPYRYTLRFIHRYGHFFGVPHALALSSLMHANSRRIASLEIHGESDVLNYYTLKFLSRRIMPLLRHFVDVGCTDPELANSESYEYFVEDDGISENHSLLQYHHRRTLPSRGTVDAWGKKMYPALEELEVTGALYDWRVFPSIQCLRKLSLRNQPWFHRPGSRTLSDLLAATSQTLEHLEIVDFLTEDEDKPWNRVEMYRLKTLVIGYCDPEEPQWVLDAISAPSLTELSLVRSSDDNGEEYDDLDVAMIMAVIEKLPLRKLRKLTLAGVIFPSDCEFDVRTPADTGDLPMEVHAYWRGMGISNLPDYQLVFPLFVFFLCQLPETKRLRVDGVDFEGVRGWDVYLAGMKEVGSELCDGSIRKEMEDIGDALGRGREICFDFGVPGHATY